jgi:hypothetical protein
MSAKVRPRVGQRQFKVRVERSDDESYTAKIAAVDDARAVVADHGLDSGIIDLVNDILLEMVREGEAPPSEND